MEASQNDDAYTLVVGKFGAPHGVKGYVRLFSYTENPQHIFSYPLRCPALAGDVKIERQGSVKGGFIAKVSGVESREGAQLLNGAEIFTQRSALPAAQEGDWYIDDLVGLAVKNHLGDVIGHVAAIHNFGAGDIIELQSGGASSIMYPFTDDFIDDVSIEGGYISMREFSVDDDMA